MNIKSSKELVDEANKEIKVLSAEEVKLSYEKVLFLLPLLKDPKPSVIFLKPYFSSLLWKGKNSPKGTNLSLLYWNFLSKL